MNAEPRRSSYRALHIDGSITVRIVDRDFTVPFELKVKTLAQHVFGQHTHEEAYVPNDVNGNPRYELVRFRTVSSLRATRNLATSQPTPRARSRSAIAAL